jgi:hypothetical protein
VSGGSLAAGACALALLASACSSSSPRPAPRTTTTQVASDGAVGMRALVAVVGDSNISLGGRALVRDLTRGTGGVFDADHLEGSFVPLFVGVAGAGIRAPSCPARTEACSTNDFWAKKLGATFARVDVDAVVSNLGINDAVVPGTATTTGYAGYDRKIDYFMRLVPSTAVVLWTNLPCAIEPSALQAGCRVINRALAEAPARWRNLKIVDWEAGAGNRMSYIDRNAPPNARVHYTDAGYAAWSELVTRALDAQFPK